MNIRRIYCVDVQPSSHQKNKEKKSPTLLGILENTATFAEKVELIRSSNPYFYLLTPKPKKEKK
jgi:hypothetical protein